MDTSSASASSMAVANNREASSLPAADDDGALSVTSGLAKEAELLFQSGKFADCIRVLNQLLQKKEGDPKILHNIAIAESFLDDFSEPKRLLEVLKDVKKRSEELPLGPGEHVDAVSSGGSKAGGSIKANNISHHNSSSDSSLVLGDEFDTSVMLYNIAVTWFHLHDYAKAFSILDSLYQNIEPIDERTALRICLLLLDVALFTQHATRCADVIAYVEKIFCASSVPNQVDNGNSVQQQSSSLVTKSFSLPSNSTLSDASHHDSTGTENVLENALSRTLSDEALEEESILSALEMSGQSLSRPSGLHSSNDFPRTQVDESISTADLRLKLHLCKVRFLLLTRNLKAAKREVKMAMNTARGKDYSMALYLKSQLEYARRNHRKAIKLLMASSNRTEMGISSIYYNNLGCIYYRLGKYHTSSVFFSKALSNSSALRKEKPLKLVTISQDKSLLITYNCGVQHLACGQPLLASKCFYKASQIFYDRPLLWLRIAECCLMALEKGLLKSKDDTFSPDRREVKVHVIGEGKWRHLVLENGLSRHAKSKILGREDILGEDRKPILSMSLARNCLYNALYLLNRSDTKVSQSKSLVGSEDIEFREVPFKTTNHKNVSGSDSKASSAAGVSVPANSNGEVKELKGGNTQNASLMSSISEHEEIRRKENLIVEQAILADLAFVELELRNPLKALSTARSILKLTGNSRVYVFLANIYAAEALCLLNRPEEAAEYLSAYVSAINGFELPYSEEDREKCLVDKMTDSDESTGGLGMVNSSATEGSQELFFLKPEEARGILFANFAAMSAMQGDLEQAQQFVLQALSMVPNMPEVFLTSIYVDLVCGKTQEAISKLKQCNRVRFISGSLKLNGSL